MEIKKVEKEVQNQYPKMEKVNKKFLKTNMPNKWQKLGVTSMMFSMMMRNVTYAVALDTSKIDIDVPLAGSVLYIPIYVKVFVYAIPIVQIVSAIISIITGYNILVNKIKSRKQGEVVKSKTWVKILFAISIILFIICSVLKKYIDIDWPIY